MNTQNPTGQFRPTFTPHTTKVLLSDVLARQSAEYGINPMPLDADLLIKRINQGGYSGQFLADAFLNAYRGFEKFNHSLKELTRLDAEGFRLFHQILHIRHVPGWSDDALYQVEKRVIAAVKNGGAA